MLTLPLSGMPRFAPQVVTTITTPGAKSRDLNAQRRLLQYLQFKLENEK
ncbi:hypothetical protein GEOBC_02395 [Geobacteraceae bacterium]|jgi:hypothetical protein|nr:hypothetical protein GEOBC_02395 [Geobacteraceae bacterium]